MEISWNRKGKWSFYRFATISALRHFYIDVVFIIVILNFCRLGTICFNIYYMSSLFYSVRNSAPCSIFPSLLKSTPFWVLSNHTVETCYCYYCSSLLTVLQPSLLPQNLSMDFPSNDNNNTEWHLCKNVTQKWWRIWEGSYIRFLLQIISQS
jgi:hypothetical protein